MEAAAVAKCIVRVALRDMMRRDMLQLKIPDGSGRQYFGLKTPQTSMVIEKIRMS